MLTAIMSAYPEDCQPSEIVALGNRGGFSGAQLWKLTTARGQLCLRRWPTRHPRTEHLRWMHQVLGHVRLSCAFIPRIHGSSSGTTYVLADGHHWELTDWMSGTADFDVAPHDKKLAAAMSALAEFHVAAKGFQSSKGCSQSLHERLEFTERLLSNDLLRLETRLSRSAGQPFHADCVEILRLASPGLPVLLSKLRSVATCEWELQPCLRDVWHDHVLFQGDEVTGMIDFGAMRVETLTGDVARLLGSLAEGNPQRWEKGLQHYQSIRGLTQDEQLAVAVMDESNRLLSGLNWIRWLFVDKKSFEDVSGVRRRLDKITQRLREKSSFSQ